MTRSNLYSSDIQKWILTIRYGLGLYMEHLFFIGGILPFCREHSQSIQSLTDMLVHTFLFLNLQNYYSIRIFFRNISSSKFDVYTNKYVKIMKTSIKVFAFPVLGHWSLIKKNLIKIKILLRFWFLFNGISNFVDYLTSRLGFIIIIILKSHS